MQSPLLFYLFPAKPDHHHESEDLSLLVTVRDMLLFMSFAGTHAMTRRQLTKKSHSQSHTRVMLAGNQKRYCRRASLNWSTHISVVFVTLQDLRVSLSNNCNLTLSSFWNTTLFKFTFFICFCISHSIELSLSFTKSYDREGSPLISLSTTKRSPLICCTVDGVSKSDNIPSKPEIRTPLVNI